MTDTPPLKMGVIVSRYPKLNDMYQLREIIELERQGIDIELFPIVRHDETVSHPEGRALEERAHFVKLLSLETVTAQLYWLVRNPKAYLRCWWDGLWGYRSSRDFVVRTLWIVPIAAVWAMRMKTLGVDRNHAHFATYPTHAALVVKRLAGIPYGFTGHAHDLQIDTTGLAEKVAEAEYVMTCTRHGAEMVRREAGPAADGKVFVVYHGIELDVYTPQPFREADPADPGEPLRICCVASFQEYKGHEYLLGACAELKADGVAIEVRLVGDGPDRELVERRVHELGLRDSVTFTGKVESTRVREHIVWSDVCALASVVAESGQLDGIPNFLTESMGLGRPVVSTRLPGILELIDDEVNGLVVPPRDAHAFAEALRRLRGDRALRARLCVAARSTLEAEHDVTVNTAECVRIYRDAHRRALARAGRTS
jgi:glycosyltransferase involved in cell wall biosynthesis